MGKSLAIEFVSRALLAVGSQSIKEHAREGCDGRGLGETSFDAGAGEDHVAAHQAHHVREARRPF